MMEQEKKWTYNGEIIDDNDDEKNTIVAKDIDLTNCKKQIIQSVDIINDINFDKNRIKLVIQYGILLAVGITLKSFDNFNLLGEAIIFQSSIFGLYNLIKSAVAKYKLGNIKKVLADIYMGIEQLNDNELKSYIPYEGPYDRFSDDEILEQIKNNKKLLDRAIKKMKLYEKFFDKIRGGYDRTQGKETSTFTDWEYDSALPLELEDVSNILEGKKK